MLTWFTLALTRTSSVSPKPWHCTPPIFVMHRPDCRSHSIRRPFAEDQNFTLTSNLGDLDLFGEVPGATTYFDLLPDSFEVKAFGVSFKCVDLPTLIRIKEVAGRPKDLEAVAELRLLLQERK